MIFFSWIFVKFAVGQSACGNANRPPADFRSLPTREFRIICGRSKCLRQREPASGRLSLFAYSRILSKFADRELGKSPRFYLSSTYL